MVTRHFVLALALLSAAPRYEAPMEVPAVVALVAGTQTFCTGFVTEPGVIVTAAHCVEEAVSAGEHFVTVRFIDGRREAFFVLGYGEIDARDFAVLVGNTADVQPLPLAATKAGSGQLCVIVGHGGGSPNQAGTPCVTLSESADGYLDLAATAIGGDSGSPVIDVDSGEVVGVLVRGSFPVPVSRAVFSPQVRAAVARLLAESRKLFPTPTSPTPRKH